MPRRHRREDIYWNAAESESDDYEPLPAKEPYIDPWDLENYAYIREHLESMELSSNPSLPFSGSSGSGGEFSEANSSSFCYVPGPTRKTSIRHTDRMTDRYNDTSGDYADIEEVKYLSRRSNDNRRKSRQYEYDMEENPYETGLRDNSVFGIYEANGRFRKVAVPVDTTYKTQIDRSLGSVYGDFIYDPYATRQEIYSNLEEFPYATDRTMPIYDDPRRLRRKPQNFGLTNYGHLKIDYSLSWNNLNKYIRYHN